MDAETKITQHQAMTYPYQAEVDMFYSIMPNAAQIHPYKMGANRNAKSDIHSKSVIAKYFKCRSNNLNTLPAPCI
jgi:hypothetical protein